MKAYLLINGVEYFDYNVIAHGVTISNPYWVNRTLWDKLRDLSYSGFDKTYKPALGSEICAVPPCSIPMDDLRKNYKIKRGIDKGCCNVFSPDTNYYHFYESIWEDYSVCIVPPQKTVFICKGSTMVALGMAKVKFPTIPVSQMYSFDSSQKYHNPETDLCGINLKESYKALLNKQFTTPCIPISSLSLNTSNELTLDILLIVHKIGSKKYSKRYNVGKSEEEPYIVELNALNNYNWREYPGTISLLINKMLETDYRIKWTYNAELYLSEIMKSHSSRYSKAVKQILNLQPQGFASEKDLKMAQALIRNLTGMGDRKFVSYGDITTKLEEINLTGADFCTVFNTIIKIEDKEFKNEEKED